MLINQIINFLETIAPPSLQEDYDNAGLLTGNSNIICTGALISLDCTEAIVQEAINKNCNLIIAHHPIVFRGLKKINGKNYVERTVIKAIKNDIAIYAIHTNLDNVLHGVNGKIAEMLGLQNVRVLSPKKDLLKKLVVFSPQANAQKLTDALFSAGAGNIGNYSECGFSTEGTGTFTPGENSDPQTGKIGTRETLSEVKIEVIYPEWLEQKILRSMKDNHPYEEVAHDIYNLNNAYQNTGSGVMGELLVPTDENDLLTQIATIFKVKVIKHTALLEKKCKKVAICGGAGSFLIPAAKAAGADVYITSDVKYHEFFDADNQILLADIGHYESEQFTIDLLYKFLSDKFPNFALLKTGVNTNPLRYFIP
ncbi:MAG: Nif3-like dinuclear metal center hexameric protein [Ferruginibacter sp.]|nr:Nif3-like dinuclear metal center hexameric protein [Ferruginibacter sp.]